MAIEESIAALEELCKGHAQTLGFPGEFELASGMMSAALCILRFGEMVVTRGAVHGLVDDAFEFAGEKAGCIEPPPAVGAEVMDQIMNVPLDVMHAIIRRIDATKWGPNQCALGATMAAVCFLRLSGMPLGKQNDAMQSFVRIAEESLVIRDATTSSVSG